MARIKTYNQDTTVSVNDKLLGTDSTTDGTKNFTIQSLLDLINSLSAVAIFDGIAFKYQSYDGALVDPAGVLNLTGGVAAATPLSSVTQIIVSRDVANGTDVTNYLEFFQGKRIKISKQDDFDTFGIFKVNSVGVWPNNNNYLSFNVDHITSNGQATPNSYYFLAYVESANVTDFDGVTSAGSGQIITDAERTTLNNALLHSDVVDNVTSTSATTPLSANQGKILKGLIEDINTLLLSDESTLDNLQEVVDYIELNRTTLNSLAISSIAGLQTALDGKVDEVAGKELSDNNFTDVLLTKLNNIASGAEVNVQSDWNATSGDALILNKPSDITDLSAHSITELSDVSGSGSGSIITSAERNLLSSIQTGAEENVQSDFNETDTNSDAFIQNKPDLTLKADKTTTVEIQGTSNELEVSPSGPQDLSANRTFTLGLPDDVTIGNDLTVTSNISVGETIELLNAQTTTPTFDNGIYYSTENGHDTLHFRYHGHDLSIDYLTENIPTGILNGGGLSTNTNTTFDVAAGDGLINILNKSNSDPHPEIKKVNWSTITVTHTLGDANNADQLNTWIYVDSAGSIQQTLTTPSPALWRNNIVLGSVIHSSNVIRFVKTFPRTAYSSGNTYAEFVEIFGPLKKSGHLLTVSLTNNMAFDRSSGESFALGRNYDVDPLNPSLVSDTGGTPVFHRYSSASSGFTKDDGPNGAGYASIDPSKYDDNGTITTTSSGQYSVQRLFHFPNNTNVIVAYYGKAEYSSIDDAEKNYLLENFQEAENTANQAIYLGALIVKGNATDLNNASQARILTGGIFRSLSAANLGGVAVGSPIGDLSDVTIASVVDKQLLQYNSSTGNFENVSDLDLGSNKVLFANVYATELDLPSASTYHGMFAHVHATGKGYFAHAGSWRKLLDESSSTTDNLTEGSTNLYFPGFGTTSTTALVGNTQFVDGTGTANKIPKFSDSDTITDSSIVEDGQTIDIQTTGSIRVPDGTTAQRPSSPAAGMFRYNTDDDQFEGYTTEWGAIAGSGGGAASVERQTHSADGSTLAFTIGQSITDENNVFVYIDGVYQEKSTFSINGSTLTFGTGNEPPNGTTVEIISYASLQPESASSLIVDQFTGDGSQTSFSLSASPRSESTTFVFVQGVYQEKSEYSVSGSTITFTTAPQNTFSVEVMSLTTVINVADVGQVQNNTFAGNGTTTSFNLSISPSNIAHTLVYINGVYQEKSTYSVSGSTLTLSQAPETGDTIEVESRKTITPQGITFSNLESDLFTATASQTSFTLVNGTPTNKSQTLVYINGVYQNKSTYSFTSGAIVLSTGADAGDEVEVVSLEGLLAPSSNGVSSVNGQTGDVTAVTSVNGQTGAVTVASSKYDVSVISTNTNAQAFYTYVFTATATLTLPASPEVGQWIKVSNMSGTLTPVVAANGNNIMGASSDLTIDALNAGFEMVYSGATKGWVLIGN